MVYLRRYLVEGGLPEAQGAGVRERAALLGSYVDVVVLRDVIERHTITNPLALHRMQRQLLGSPAAPFSILIPLFERSGSPNTGQALETVILIELLRRGYDVAYVRTPEGWEVDFLAQAPGREPLLIQVTASVTDAAARQRELRALTSGSAMIKDAQALLITLDTLPPHDPLPASVTWMPAGRPAIFG